MLIVIGFALFYYLNDIAYISYESDKNSIRIKTSILTHLHKKLSYAGLNYTVYSFIYLSVIIGLLVGSICYGYTRIVFTSLILSFISLLFPWIVIDIKGQKTNNLLSLEVSKLISGLARWSIIKDDIFYCFEKSVDQLNEPLKSYVQDFILQVKYSGHIGYAFDIVIEKTQHEMLRTLMINLQQSSHSKGNLQELLEHLEEESYQIFGEHERRKTELYFDRIAILFCISLVLMVTIIVFLINEPMRSFYLTTDLGQNLLSVFTLLFFLGVVNATRINSFNY